MVLILLEALGALLLLVFIVWWTMFSGRKNGELPAESDTQAGSPQTPAPAPVPVPPQDAADRPVRQP